MGTNVIVKCEAEGVPRPLNSWLMNGTIVLHQKIAFNSQGSGDYAKMGVTLADIGFYTCIAENSFGRDSYTSFIKIIGTCINVQYIFLS